MELPTSIRDFLSKFNAAGFDIWLVGGGVRHLLAGKPITNPDFTTNATPAQIQALFPDSFYDNAFGTVGIPVGDEVYEVTTYRTERHYTDKRHPDKVEWGKTLAEDLSRRDFTINAMVIGKDLNLIDPFDGKKDLDAKIIRAVGNPKDRFNEDALRMIRAVRIATQLELTIEPPTLQAIKQASATITAVSWERIRDELFKILSSGHPADGITLLDDTDLLPYIIPELVATKNVPQGGHHIHDVWNHSLESLRFCPSPDPLVRLATLLHDIGKPSTLRHQGPRGVTFYGHEVVGARIVRQVADRLRLSKKDKDKLITLVRWHMFTYAPHMTDAAIRRFIRRVGVANIPDMMCLRIGDRLGGGSSATSWRLRELQRRIYDQLHQPLTVADLAVDGHDVMKLIKISPGQRVGQVLATLFKEIESDTSKNNRDYLLQRIKELTPSS
jgi:tRNA nucleotidyltransferase (CCA-adding enzyme)